MLARNCGKALGDEKKISRCTSVHTVYMLLVQMVLAFMFFVNTTDYFTLQLEGGDELASGLKAWLPRWLLRLRLDSRKWLFGDPDCYESMPSPYADEYGQVTSGGEPLKYCGVVYDLLHPEGSSWPLWRMYTPSAAHPFFFWSGT